MDLAVKPLYGHQEGAKAGYNPRKPGRPSHSYYTYMLANLRLLLRVDVLPGDEHNVKHATDGLWDPVDHLGPARPPAVLRSDNAWGIEAMMARAKQEILAYLFRLRMTANVRRTLFVRLTDPDHHREAITSRPSLHTAIGWQTAHAGKIIEVWFQDEARDGHQGA